MKLMARKVKKLSTLGALISALFSCAQVDQRLDPQIYYKKDMKVRVNGYVGNGVLVVPKSSEYDIKAWFKGEGDLVTMSTCHREVEWEDLGSREEFKFKPVKGMEDNGKCLMELAAYEHKRGRHSWAIIDFENTLFQLPALVKCNGSTYNSRGVTICQSKEGLYQQISFPEPVTFSKLSKCEPLPISNDGKVSKFKMPNRECTFIFKGKETGRLHKIMLVGYEEIIIRQL